MKTVTITQIRTISIPCNTDSEADAIHTVLSEWKVNNANLVNEDFDNITVVARVSGNEANPFIVSNCNHDVHHQIMEPLIE